MHKNIRAAVIGRDKAISAIWVEEFDPPTWHAHLIRLQRTVSAPDPPRRRATATDRGLAHALRLFGTKRVMPERVILQERLAASNAAGCLIHCFDRILADGLDRLVTVRAKVSPGLRFEEASACSRLSHSVIATRLGGAGPSKPTTFPPPVRKLRPPMPPTAWILPSSTAAASAPRVVGRAASRCQRSLAGSYSCTSSVGVQPSTTPPMTKSLPFKPTAAA